MSLGIAVFASVVLLLVVYHKTFRKVFFWTAGIAAVGCGLFFGGVYLYGRYQERQQEKREQAALLHKNLVDDCMKRYAASGYVDHADDFFLKLGGTIPECEGNPATDWSAKPAPKFDPNQPYGTVIEIHGGETLKIVQNSAQPSNAPPGVLFDMSSSIPLLYLGTFELVCGDYGEKGTSVVFNQRTVTCR